MSTLIRDGAAPAAPDFHLHTGEWLRAMEFLNDVLTDEGQLLLQQEIAEAVKTSPADAARVMVGWLIEARTMIDPDARDLLDEQLDSDGADELDAEDIRARYGR